MTERNIMYMVHYTRYCILLSLVTKIPLPISPCFFSHVSFHMFHIFLFTQMAYFVASLRPHSSEQYLEAFLARWVQSGPKHCRASSSSPSASRRSSASHSTRCFFTFGLCCFCQWMIMGMREMARKEENRKIAKEAKLRMQSYFPLLVFIPGSL